MSLKSLTSFISNTQITKELIQRINNNNDLNVIGSSRYAKALIINGIATSEKKNILLISPSTEIAYKWYGYFQSIENEKVLYYPPNENLPYEDRTKSIEVEYAQLNIISQLISNETNKKFNRKIIITTERALQPHLINTKYFRDSILYLDKGKVIELKTLILKLTQLGYKKEEITTNEGQWSQRGEIIDVFPVNNEVPIRIEFFDNTIEKIREYDPSNQRTLETINSINISQSASSNKIKKELINLSNTNEFYLEEKNITFNLDRFLGLIEASPSSIKNFIDSDTYIIFDELEQCMNFTENWFKESENNFNQNKISLNNILKSNSIDKEIKPNLFKNIDDIYSQFNDFKRINLYEFDSKKNKKNRFLISDKPIKSPNKNIVKISKEINEYIKNKKKVWVL